jgi:signal transduction histidine kinase
VHPESKQTEHLADRFPQQPVDEILLKWRLPKSTQQRFIAVGFLAAIILRAFLFFVSYRASTKFVEWNNLSARTRVILLALDEFSQSVRKAQMAAVAYSLGGADSLIQTFSSAETEEHAALAHARSLALNPDLQRNMDALAIIADQYLTLLRGMIQPRQAGASGTESMDPVNEGSQLIDTPLSKTLADTISGENRLLEIRSSGATTSARTARTFEMIGGPFSIILLVLMGVLFLRENSIRANAFDQLGLLNSRLGSAIALVREENEERIAAEAGVIKLNAELEERVHHRTAELESANKELEAFCYSVSHDLRAPLRSIDGFSLALAEDHCAQLDDDGKALLQRVRTATVRMGTLIDDLLDLSRITRSEMHREPVDISKLASTIATELRSTQPDRIVEFAIAPGLQVKGDLRLIRIALQNLLGNAWKFTSKRDHARIEFGRANTNGSSSFFVGDNGAGFDPAYAGRMFGAFQRLHAASDFPGTGVGLATVQRIVHRHGGEIWAKSKLNVGATFFFTLEPSTHKQETK